MTPTSKDYRSTILRMAGNIAAGLVTCPAYQDADGVPMDNIIANKSLQLAQRIVETAVQQMQRAEAGA